jgi:hypothetical protein
MSATGSMNPETEFRKCKSQDRLKEFNKTLKRCIESSTVLNAKASLRAGTLELERAPNVRLAMSLSLSLPRLLATNKQVVSAKQKLGRSKQRDSRIFQPGHENPLELRS